MFDGVVDQSQTESSTPGLNNFNRKELNSVEEPR
jgi:hypothetical protein